MFFRWKRKRRGPDDIRQREHTQGKLRHASNPRSSSREHADALADEGEASETEGNYDQAIRAYTGAIKLDRRLARAYRGRANAWARMGRLRRALKDYDEAIRLEPHYLDALMGRGGVLAARGHYDHALDDQNRAIELDPRCAEAYRLRGLVHREMGDQDRAIEDMTTAVQLDPHNEEGYYSRGIAFERKGLRQQAFEDYTSAIGIDPEDSRVLIRRSALAFAMMEDAMMEEERMLEGLWHAGEDLWKAYELSPENPAIAFAIDTLRPRFDGARIPGGTLAVPQLQRDTLLHFHTLGGMQDRLSGTSNETAEPPEIEVIDTKVIEPPRNLREGWVEQWKVVRGGHQVDFRMEYKGDGSGGYFITAEDASDESASDHFRLGGLPPSS